LGNSARFTLLVCASAAPIAASWALQGNGACTSGAESRGGLAMTMSQTWCFSWPAYLLRILGRFTSAVNQLPVRLSR
jgi:hypothetical protein